MSLQDTHSKSTRRKYTSTFKRELVKRCMRPGASVSGIALENVRTESTPTCCSASGANTCGAPHATRVMTFQSGTSSEQLGAQLALVPAEPPQTAPAAEPPKNKQGRKADAPCACGECGGKLRQLGEDVSEQLEYRVQRALCAAHAAGAVARLASCTATSAFRLSIRRTTA